MKPEDGYISYIVNPKSGSSSSRFATRQLEEYFTAKGFDVRVNVTSSLEDACELATDAAVDYDCGLVVAIGGDGTVREVAHGLEGSDTPLLIVPRGTENLLANELGFDEKLSTIISAFENGEIRSLDLGCIGGKCFTCVSGFGFDGEVVEKVSSVRYGHIDHFNYVWPIWRSFWNYKFEPMKVEVDGEEVFDGRGLVFVGNISRYAIGLQLLQKADYGDGLLDVCIYKCHTKLRLAKHAVMTVLKLHRSTKDVVYKQGKEIKVFGSENIKTEIDGDPGPKLPVDIKVIPHAVKVLVPKGAKPAGLRTRILRTLK